MFMAEESLFGLLDPEYLLIRLNIPQNLDVRNPYCQYIKETYIKYCDPYKFWNFLLRQLCSHMLFPRYDWPML
jgi:hypothetical protein